ncbi:RICIN domain-containing protein [Streptomyces sp. NBC_00445]|uniref:RICIN domain-containing protein n=1 Tax=Streptomyces sp. NBC_00445 TaxID=2975745 RepID=UPI002E1DCB05
MSETEQDDTKRRQRARFVDALTTNAQQPGERSRVGTKVTGAVAVLALAAGATLGLGAWRSYQADEDDKQEKLATEQAAEHKNLTRSPSPKPTKTSKDRSPDPHTKGPGSGATTNPSASKEKKEQAQEREMREPQRMQAAVNRFKVLVKNASTGMCADVPNYGPGKVSSHINQYPCNGTDKDNQLWNMRVRHVGKGPGGTHLVTFSNAKDGLCMDVPTQGAQPPGTPLNEARCVPTLGESNQLWWLDPTREGTVQIRNYASNHLCLEVKDDRKAAAQRLILDKCGTDGDSRWRLTR